MMMPFDLRLDYAVRYCTLVFAGYVSAAVFYVLVAVLIDPVDYGIDFSDSFEFVLLTLSIFALGASALLGAMVAAILVPAVVARRMFWFISLLVGSGIATGAAVLFFFFDAADGGVLGLMFLAVLAGGLTGLVLHVIGMATGLLRKWFPRGACQACGYDLRHRSAQGTCPDCGAAAENPFST